MTVEADYCLYILSILLTIGFSLNKCTFELSLPESNISEAHIQGDWVIGNVVPVFKQIKQQLLAHKCVQLILHGNKLGHWDSRFVLFLYELDAYCKAQNIQLDMTNLPVAAQGLLHQASAFPVRESGQKVLHETALLAQIGQHVLGLYKQTQDMLAFVGEVCLSSQP